MKNNNEAQNQVKNEIRYADFQRLTMYKNKNTEHIEQTSSDHTYIK